MKKKLLSVVLTAVMAASVLTGCGSTDNGTASTAAATGTAQSEQQLLVPLPQMVRYITSVSASWLSMKLWMQQPRDSRML